MPYFQFKIFFWIIQFKIFLIALVMSFFTNVLFSNIWGFFVYILILISNLIIGWSYIILNDFNSFKRVEIYFMTQYMISFGKCSIYTWNNMCSYIVEGRASYMLIRNVKERNVIIEAEKLERCDCWNVPQPGNAGGL